MLRGSEADAELLEEASADGVFVVLRADGGVELAEGVHAGNVCVKHVGGEMPECASIIPGQTRWALDAGPNSYVLRCEICRSMGFGQE